MQNNKYKKSNFSSGRLFLEVKEKYFHMLNNFVLRSLRFKKNEHFAGIWNLNTKNLPDRQQCVNFR